MKLPAEIRITMDDDCIRALVMTLATMSESVQKMQNDIAEVHSRLETVESILTQEHL